VWCIEKLFVYPSSCLFTQQMPMFTGNTPLMMYCLRQKKIRQNEFEASLSFLFSRVFQNTHIAFSWSFYHKDLWTLFYMMPRPPLFHKITTPRPHTHKKRSQMIPSSIRKNVQQNKYKFLFHVFFKKLLLSCYYSIITTHFIINTGNGITFFHHFR